MTQEPIVQDQTKKEMEIKNEGGKFKFDDLSLEKRYVIRNWEAGRG